MGSGGQGRARPLAHGVKWCVDGQNETIKMLGIKFDKIYRESAIFMKTARKCFGAARKRVFSQKMKRKPCCELPGEPDKVVLRADGTAVYITTDLHSTVKKIEENKLDKCVWIVGNEQDQYLRQLFGVLRF